VLGYAINCCATARDALLTGAKYHAVASSINRLALSEDARHAYWIATHPMELHDALPFAIEEEFSAFCRNSELLTGKKAPIAEVHFTYNTPLYVDRYPEVFGTTLCFHAPKNQIVFDVGALDLPILQGNPLSVMHGIALCEDFLASNPRTDDLTMRICAMLLRTPGAFPPAEAVAAQLNISARTLRYQLAQVGESYQSILERLKLKLAKDYLHDSPLKVEDIAWRLGYLDARNFRRAFKSWTGVTPNEYRQAGTRQGLAST
jgi:AraC-like DNA-binding protein